MLPWLQSRTPPLYLAPMAGVTDFVFRGLCRELGADVMVTEFVSAEGILQQDQRTRRYTLFSDQQRPVGVQLFGADPGRLGEAARKVIDWKQPDFIDINFGCPVKKVVSRNGGSSLLKDCPLLTAVAGGIVRAVGDQLPVTAKIRIGWDQQHINAVDVCRRLEDVGVQAIAIHGRTRAQGYSGEANWDVIGECAAAVSVPVIGNGDLAEPRQIADRIASSGVAGAMIGRAAMQNPWLFAAARAELEGRPQPAGPSDEERWQFILRHVRLAIEWGRYGDERCTLQSMRSRLMAYSRGLHRGKQLRVQFSGVTSVAGLEDIAAAHLAGESLVAEAA